MSKILMHYCLFKNEILDDFKQYTFYKRGMTSILLEYDNNNLLMFTRDYIKSEYLTNYLKFEKIYSYYSNGHYNSLMKNTLINIIKVPKLSKISIKEHNQLLKTPKNIINNNYYFEKQSSNLMNSVLNLILEQLSEDSILYDYMYFLTNFEDFTFDIKRDSILKDSNTNIYYPIDIVIPTMLTDIIHSKNI